MNHREANDLDRHITGNWGEDSVDAEPEDAPDPRIAAADEMAKALEEMLREKADYMRRKPLGKPRARDGKQSRQPTPSQPTTR